MRHWSTDGSIERDTRYPAWLRWLWRRAWLPTWLLARVHTLYQRMAR